MHEFLLFTMTSYALYKKNKYVYDTLSFMLFQMVHKTCLTTDVFLTIF